MSEGKKFLLMRCAEFTPESGSWEGVIGVARFVIPGIGLTFCAKVVRQRRTGRLDFLLDSPRPGELPELGGLRAALQSEGPQRREARRAFERLVMTSGESVMRVNL
jgi:hypothetical protein